jgi:predicted NAD/FAD-binding protein
VASLLATHAKELPLHQQIERISQPRRKDYRGAPMPVIEIAEHLVDAIIELSKKHGFMQVIRNLQWAVIEESVKQEGNLNAASKQLKANRTTLVEQMRSRRSNEANCNSSSES